MGLCGKRSDVVEFDEQHCDVLLLGLEGSGKTLLAKRLQTLHAQQKRGSAKQPPFSVNTLSTVGTEFFVVPCARTSQFKSFSVREVGGAMCALWPQYTEECSMLLFTLDMGSAGTLAECMVEFYELLQSPNLVDKPIALVLTKYDMPSLMSRAELDMVMALSDLQALSPGRVTIFETSAVSGDDLEELLTWVVACKSAATALSLHASQRSSQG